MIQGHKNPKRIVLYFIGGNFVLASLILGIVAHQIMTSREQVINQSMNHVKNLSMVTEEALHASLKGIEVVLNDIAFEVKSVGVKKVLDQDLSNHYLKGFDSKTMSFNWVDSKGDLIWTTTPKGSYPDRKINVAERSYFQDIKNSKTEDVQFSEPVFGKIQSRWLMVVGRKLTDKNGKFLGVVMYSLTSDFFAELQSKISLKGNDLFVVAVGSPPRFLFRYPLRKGTEGTLFNPPVEAFPVLKKEVHRGVYRVVSTRDNVPRISAHTWVENYPLIVVVGKDIAEALQAWQTQSITTLVMTLLVVLGSAILSWFFLKSQNEFRTYQVQLANSAKFVALGEMSGSVAHEINNPLMIISGNVEKLERLIEPQDQQFREQAQATIAKIHTTLARISKIVSGLQKISHHRGLHATQVSLVAVIQEAIGMCIEKFKSAGVELSLVDNGLDPEVSLNETQFLQVLVNLLNNAFFEVSKKPNAWVKIELQKSKGWIHIEVTDSGPGISQEIASQMMTPFFTTKEVGKGTGLGLSISKEIIESHGGKFYYDPSSKNTKFNIELPATESKTKPTKAKAA
jgi:signal transduction histidine kinase